MAHHGGNGGKHDLREVNPSKTWQGALICGHIDRWFVTVRCARDSWK